MNHAAPSAAAISRRLLTEVRAHGAAILDQAHKVVLQFCVLPSPEAAHAVVLWCAATHALPVLPAAPRLAITSPVKRTGKTRLLDVVEGISYDPLTTMNASTPAVFRSLDREHPPTLIFDEVDTIFGSKRVAENNEDLRGLINAGFQRGKSALRCVGPLQVPTQFATFAMAALAGIGSLPDTITDRAVNIRMRRRKPGETVAPFRERRDRPMLTAVHDELAGWLTDPTVLATLEAAEPRMDLEDRAADVWEPLIAVADLAGGHWPELSRTAARRLTSDAAEDDDETDGLRALHDLRHVFELVKSDWVPTEILVVHLRQIEEAPWSEMELTGHRLGKLLGEFGIKSCHNTERTKRGYIRSSFTDAWERYPVQKRADQASEPSLSVHAPPDQGKLPDTSPDTSLTPSKASDKASAGSCRSDPVRTLPDGSDAYPADNWPTVARGYDY